MLRNLREISGAKVLAHDGKVGKVADFLFDGDTWQLLYLSVDTGNWLLRHDVLVSPADVDHAGVATHTVSVHMNKDQVRHCPEAELAPPLAHLADAQSGRHFQWPMYGEGAGLWAASMWTLPMEGAALERSDPKLSHLRSYEETLTYQIRTSDGELGVIKGLIIDDVSWSIHYLVVGTGFLFSRHSALVPTAAVSRRDDHLRIFDVKLAAEAVLASPPYRKDVPITREFEEQLFQHFGIKHLPAGDEVHPSAVKARLENFFGKRAG